MRLTVASFLVLSGPGLFAQVNANFSANPVSGCIPVVVNFTDLSTGGVNYWEWDFGNGNISFSQNPSAAYITSGSYTVTLIVSNGIGWDTLVLTNLVTVFVDPAAQFSAAPGGGCVPLSVQFSDLSTPGSGAITQWLWDFGDGSFSNAQNPQHTYTTPGTYTVSLIITDANGCSDTRTQVGLIQVTPRPTAFFVASPLAACDVPLIVTFTNLSTGAATYQWDFGDGNTSTLAAPVHAYSSFGVYTVSLIVTNASGCSDTLIRPNYINLQPVLPAFIMSPNLICRGETVTFTNQSTGFTATYSYLWDFGDGTTAAGTDATHTYYSAGIFTVTLTVTSSLGCVVSATQVITVLPSPLTSFAGAPLFSCSAPLTVAFTDLSAGAVGWSWDFDDGGTSSVPNPTHTFLGEGAYDITLTTTGLNGCDHDTTLVDYVIIDFPDAGFSATPVQGCIPLDVQFTDSSTSTDPIVSWLWSFGDGGVSLIQNPVHTYTTTGVFDATLIIVTASGCTDTITRPQYIRTGTPPQVNFTAVPTFQCLGDTVQFTDLSTGGNAWLWDFGDGTASAQQHPGHVYNDTGIFSIQLIVWDNGCPDTLIVPNYITIVGVRAGIDTVMDCIDPYTVQFIDASQYGPDAYLWDFGDGSTSTLASPAHTYSSTGSYTVIQTVYDLTNGCDDTAALTITIADLSVGFTAFPLTGCRPLPVNFVSTSVDAVSYYWDFGDGSVSGMQNPLHTYTQNGAFTVTLIVEDINGCRDTLVRPGYVVVQGPVVGFVGSPVTGCAPLLVSFTDTSYSSGSNIVSWFWTFGDGGTSTLQNPTHLYSTANNYSVGLTVTDANGCTAGITRTPYIVATQPAAQFNAAPFACPGDMIFFQNLSQGAGLQYTWVFGDGDSSTATNPNHIYVDSGTYAVKLLVTDFNGCTDSLLDTVDIRQPRAAFSAAPTSSSCPPLTVSFTDLSYGNITSWFWTFGDGSFSTLQHPTHTYVNSGIYNVRLIITTNQNCRDTVTMDSLVTITGPSGTFTFSPQSGCSPVTVNFVASASNTANYTWDFGDGTVITTTSNTTAHTYTLPGVFHPVAILNDGLGCVAAVGSPDSVVVLASPLAVIEQDTTICIGDTVQLMASGGASYNWTPAASLGCAACDSTTAAPQTTTTYSVEVVATNGCTDTGYVTVGVLAFPNASTSPDAVICAGQSIGISAFGGTQYTWQPGAALSCTSCQSPVASPLSTITYSVEVSNGYCSDFDSLTITVLDTVPAVAGPDTAICVGNSAVLWALGQPTSLGNPSYAWVPGSSLDNDTLPTVVATPGITTTYTVTISNTTCEPAVRQVTVVVHPLPSADAGPDKVTFAGMPVQITASGTGNSPVSYQWVPIAGLDCDTCEDPTATLSSTTTFRFMVTDGNGCRQADSVIVRVLDQCSEALVFVPNTFTPNGDGANDVLYVRSFGVKQVTAFRIFDRWGDVVFETADPAIGWDGTFRGRELDPAVFVYTVEGVCLNDENFVTSGNVAIVK